MYKYFNNYYFHCINFEFFCKIQLNYDSCFRINKKSKLISVFIQIRDQINLRELITNIGFEVNKYRVWGLCFGQ